LGSKEEKGEATEPKGAAEQLIGALGLTELILGSLALYGMRRYMTPSVLTQQFPSSGFDWADVALLACGAAVLGKVVTLFSWIVMAGVYREVAGRNFLKYRSRLIGGLNSYRERVGGKPFGNCAERRTREDSRGD
jgi:hypothetical protein